MGQRECYHGSKLTCCLLHYCTSNVNFLKYRLGQFQSYLKRGLQLLGLKKKLSKCNTMLRVRVVLVLLLCYWVTLSTSIKASFIPTAKPGCPTHCGNLTIPYPFGIGPSCSINDFYSINCNNSFNPPRPILANLNLEIIDIDISESHIRIKNNYVASRCYQNNRVISSEDPSLDLSNPTFMFSSKSNNLTVIGCDGTLSIRDSYHHYTTASANCRSKEELIDGSCTGIGCSQVPISNGFLIFSPDLSSLYNHSNVSEFNPCGYAFLGEKGKYTFSVDDVWDPTFVDRVKDNVPIVIEWAVGHEQDCTQARQNKSTYACQNNTSCMDHSVNYVNCPDVVGYICMQLPAGLSG